MSFQRFNRADDIVENQRTTITSGLWTGGGTQLTTFFTASAAGEQTGSYLNIYNADPATDSSAEVQFSIGYANINGSGSAGNTTKSTLGRRQTAALYGQFRNLLLAPNTNKFTFTGAPAASSSGYNDFYFVSFNRARMREKVNPGNWELTLSGSTNNAKPTKLIDDSSTTSGVTVDQGGRVFNIVSGSIANGVHVAAASQDKGSFGLFYPDLGILILNRDPIADSGSVATSLSADAFDFNHKSLFNSIVSGSSFRARREEEISSTNFFCRINNKKFNFSSNPTFATASDGSLTQPTFFKDPQTFITSVGLYNDDNELLAVAKLSKPLLNSYAREAIIKVKLDF